MRSKAGCKTRRHLASDPSWAKWIVWPLGTFRAIANWQRPTANSGSGKFFGIHRVGFSRYTRRPSFVVRNMAKAGADSSRRVALFYTCTVNYNEPETGRACVKVLEKNGIDVACPEQRCCGMPFLDGGDIDAARRNARANVDSLHALVKQSCDVVVPGPTCSYMLKQEYPHLLNNAAAREVAAHTFVSASICDAHGQGKK